MRYSSAFVLSSLAIGQAAATNVRHASFHARRQEEAKRDLSNVDWSKVDYDLSDVNWSSVCANGACAPGATATPATSAAAVNGAKAYTQAVSSVAAAATSVAAQAYSAASSKSSAAASASATASTSTTSSKTDLVSGVAKWISQLNIIQMGVNSYTNNGKAWINNDGDYVAHFKNGGDGDVMLTCWDKTGTTGINGFCVNTNRPYITVMVPSDGVDISFATGFSGACAPARSTTQPAYSGGVNNTWLEFTWDASYPTFDVSKEYNSDGSSISAVGSKCTSDDNTCVFKCDAGSSKAKRDSDALYKRSSCLTGYSLQNCDGAGTQSGSDKGAASGGCLAEKGNVVQVTLS